MTTFPASFQNKESQGNLALGWCGFSKELGENPGRVDLGWSAILAHNVLSHGSEMRDFLGAIENHPDLETWIERRSRAGISVSVKGR